MDRPPHIKPHHLEQLALIEVRQSSMEQGRDNVGSTDVQRGLRERARAWGWPESRIRIIDEVGVSGSTGLRPEFQNMLDLIDRDEVAIVFFNDASRLSRNPLDAESFLVRAMTHGVLVEIGGKLYAPGDADLPELFGLRIQNLLAWYDQANRTRIFRDAKHAKIRRGLAVSRPPDGFIRISPGKWDPHPDPHVYESLRRPLVLYLELGSGRKVAQYMRREGLLLPRTVNGQIVWEPASQLRILRLLRNPLYTDAYVYNRTRQVGTRTVTRPRSEWLIERNHHKGYITWDEWERIQLMLDRNRSGSAYAVRGGAALLKGLLWCQRCGLPVKAPYNRRVQDKNLPAYFCTTWQGDELLRCLWVPAERVDAVVVKVVLAGLTAPSVEEVRTMFRTHQDEHGGIQRSRDTQLKNAEAEVTNARQRYLAVDPKHDLVFADMGVHLQAAIQRRDEIRRERASASANQHTTLNEGQVEALITRWNRSELIWHAPTTTDEDRKRILQTVLSRVVIRDFKAEWVDLEVVWKNGFRESCRAIRSKGIGLEIAELRAEGYTDTQVAERLHAKGVVARAGGKVCRAVIAKRVARLGIQHEVTWRAGLLRIRELMEQGWSSGEILQELKTNGPRHYHNAWTLRIVQDGVRRLQTGTGPLWGVPPLLDYSARRREAAADALSLMQRRRREGWSWGAIAEELNRAGFRPAHASRFTRALCTLMYCVWRRDGSFPKCLRGRSIPAVVDATGRPVLSASV